MLQKACQSQPRMLPSMPMTLQSMLRSAEDVAKHALGTHKHNSTMLVKHNLTILVKHNLAVFVKHKLTIFVKLDLTIIVKHVLTIFLLFYVLGTFNL